MSLVDSCTPSNNVDLSFNKSWKIQNNTLFVFHFVINSIIEVRSIRKILFLNGKRTTYCQSSITHCLILPASFQCLLSHTVIITSSQSQVTPQLERRRAKVASAHPLEGKKVKCYRLFTLQTGKENTFCTGFWCWELWRSTCGAVKHLTCANLFKCFGLLNVQNESQHWWWMFSSCI